MQRKKHLKDWLGFIKQLTVDEVKQKYMTWLFCHYKWLAGITLVGMFVLKMMHPHIDPWT